MNDHFFLFIDPQYRLKGAARVAMEYYAPPSTKVLLDETDLFETKHGIFYSFLKGLEYLQALKDYAIYVRDVMHKVKDSIQVFEQMLQLDVTDKLVICLQISNLVMHSLFLCLNVVECKRAVVTMSSSL